ncbi:GAF domain-containing protein [Patescibacteria group bacterium]|nr:GAF domain-containing protein [Patescibacteria group bacterium]
MDKYFIYLFLVGFVILVALGFAIFLLLKNFKRKEAQCQRKLEETRQGQQNLYDTFSGLTAFSGIKSALDYIAKNLQKAGFPRVLIFTIDKDKRVLKPEIVLGFKGDLDLKTLAIPINHSRGAIARSLLENKFFVVENQAHEVYKNLEVKEVLSSGSFMMAPIAKKSDERCWEIFNCGRTECPAYENADPRCWTLPKTQCLSHLREIYDEKTFLDPDSKLKACLNCKRFQSLGVMIVADNDFVTFNEDDKKLFRTFAYEAGSKLERAYLLADLETREREITKRMYELSILKELGERIGYSLNIQKIADIIIGSLRKLIDYSSASYILIDPDKEKLIFKCQLETVVSRPFIDTVKERMLAGLSVLINRELKTENLDESLSGAVLEETITEPVQSFFNIPLTLGEKVVGMINVASTRPGLYKEDEMTILYKITAQASNAVTRLQGVLDVEQGKINAMVASMADGVLMIDKENRVYVINPKVKKMLGLEKDEVSIFDLIDILAGKLDFRTKFEESIKLDRLIVVEEVYVQERFLKILFSPVKDQEGEVLGTVVLFHDITHDKEIEKMREDFTNMIVHDLRSPLNGIRLMAEFLKKGEVLDEESKESINLIHNSSASMLDLVSSLLDVAKIESGKFVVNKQLGDLRELIVDRIKFFQPQLQDKKMELGNQIDGALPQVKLDLEETKQALSNLLANAIKFTEDGGRVAIQALYYKQGEDIEKRALDCGIKWFINQKTPEIRALDKDSVICAVTDNGCGIPRKEIPKLFNKFEQIKNVYKPKSVGTGLGLVIVKGIIDAHGGVVGVESQLDKGSTFFFTLPAG